MDLDPDRLDVPMDTMEAQTDDEMMEDPTHPTATTHSVDPDGDIEFDEEDEGGMEAEPTPPIGVTGVTGFNFEEPGMEQEIEEAIMEDMGGDEVERVANNGSFVTGGDAVSGEAAGVSVIATATVDDSALSATSNEQLGTLEEDHGEEAEQTDHLDDAEHVDYAAHNEAHEGVEQIAGAEYSEGDHTGHAEGVESADLTGEAEHAGEGDYEIAEEDEGGDHDGGDHDGGDPDAVTWDEGEEYDEAHPDEIHDEHEHEHEHEHDEDFNHDDEDYDHEGDITADVDETEDGQGGVTKGTAVPASAAVDLEEHAEGEDLAEDSIPHPGVEAAVQTPLAEELSREPGSQPQDADEVYFDIEEDEYDEEDLDMDYPHDIHSLPPIILHLPTSLQAGDARILFATSPEVSETPILLDGRLEALGESSLSDVWKAIRMELGGEKREQKGEMILTEKQMELKMGEDDIQLQSVTLLELAQVYCGCGLPSPMELYVTYEPHRFITRFNAIQQEVQAQLREMSEDAQEEAESAIVVGVNVEDGGDAYHGHGSEAEGETVDEAEDAAEAEAEDEAEQEEAVHGEAEGDEDDNVERETRTEEQSRPKRALQGDTNAEHGSKRGRPAPEESAHPHADWANSKPVQILGTTSILPRKLKDAEDSTTSPDSAEIFDILPPPNRREMPEGEGKYDDDDEVNGEDEERNVDIEQSGEDQLDEEDTTTTIEAEMSENVLETTYIPGADDVSRPTEGIVNTDQISFRGDGEDFQEDNGPLATAVNGSVPLDEVERKRAVEEARGVTEHGDAAAPFDPELNDTAPEATPSVNITKDNASEVADPEATVDAMVVRRDPTNLEDGEVETGVIDNPVEVDEAADELHAAADAIEDAEEGDDIASPDKKLATAKANLVVALDETDAYASDDEDGDTVSDHGFGIGHIADRAVVESEVDPVSPADTLQEEVDQSETPLPLVTHSVDDTPFTSTSRTSSDPEVPFTASTDSALVPPETSLDSVVETEDPLSSADLLDPTETASSAVKRSFALDDDDKDTNEDSILSSKRSRMDASSL